MILRPEIAARLFNTALLMHPGKLGAALAGITGRMSQGGVALEGTGEPMDRVAFENGCPSAGRDGELIGQRYRANVVELLEVADGIALIPIEGTLIHKGAYVGAYSGRTSYEGLQAQVLRAMRNPAIKGAVFEVDSFGGELAGAFETADMIAQLSAVKPTLAILTDYALSAGYLLASATRQIIMPEHGRAGSIGVVTLHTDWSAALDRQGVKVTVLRAGVHKLLDGFAHVAQSIEVIFTTRLGERVQRRWFGSPITAMLGKALTPATVLRFFTCLVVAIEVWEPRYKVTRIVPGTNSTEWVRQGAFSFIIEGIYRPRALAGDFTPEGAPVQLSVGSQAFRWVVQSVT
jgi:phage baseplate assembly protein W